MNERVFAMLLVALLLLGCQAKADGWGEAEQIVRGPEDDWAYEHSPESRERLKQKKPRFSCKSLDAYIKANDPWAAFYVVRDAALFEDRECIARIEKRSDVLRENSLTNMALLFLKAKSGDDAALDALVDIFDREALASKEGPARDHVVVSLFGFLPDWEKTGRRLLRHARYSDGAASEINLDALIWKKYLYGGAPDYKNHCEQAAEREGMASRSDFLCNPPTR